MSNRRDFFKTLLAAPLAAPALFAESEKQTTEAATTVDAADTVGSSEYLVVYSTSTNVRGLIALNGARSTSVK